MSWQPALAPELRAAPSCDPVETVIVPRARDLGGFEVRRALPSAKRQMVGPFIFFDQFGPVELLTGEGLDVRPHPHIGLATVTYLLAGSIVHRDSLGTLQPITPGDVNWMTAGRGIVHSERSDPESRQHPQQLYGVQIWVALPERHEETAAAFAHHAAAALPVLDSEGKRVRVIAGSLFGQVAPVRTFSELFYADARLLPGAALPLDAGHEERAAYLVEGTVEIAGQRFEPGRLLVFRPGDRVTIRAVTPARLLLVGGEPMEGPRYVWWNFVSSRKERIEEAKQAWKKQRFDAVPGESEFIPLPEKL
jgi:redox-sensitive bicupin YhaK (pirin superfamily)